ncbi:MAG: hypothetical protein V1738_06815 [Patescibacteria group bacterium]
MSVWTPTQIRVIEATNQASAQFVQFIGIYRFFAGRFGCDSRSETAYIVAAVYRDYPVMTGFCVTDGEDGPMRSAPMRRFTGTDFEDPESSSVGGAIGWQFLCLLRDRSQCIDRALVDAGDSEETSTPLASAAR